MKNKSLLLHPLDKNEQPDIDRLIQALRGIRFIDAVLDETENRFLVGDDFLKLITFLGCSPNVELAPTGDNGAFCHVSLVQTQPQLLTSAHTRNPRCPACRKDAASLSVIISAMQARDAKQWQCTSCSETVDIQNMNWRHTAGNAGFFVEISNIFPDEAVPSDELMSALQKATNSKWDYFYYYNQ